MEPLTLLRTALVHVVERLVKSYGMPRRAVTRVQARNKSPRQL